MLTSVLALLSGAGRTLLNFGSSAKSSVQNKLNSLLRSLGFREPATKEERREILEEIKEEIEQELDNPNPKFNEVILRRETDHLKIYRINNTAKIMSLEGLITYIEPTVSRGNSKGFSLSFAVNPMYLLGIMSVIIAAAGLWYQRKSYLRNEVEEEDNASGPVQSAGPQGEEETKTSPPKTVKRRNFDPWEWKREHQQTGVLPGNYDFD